MNKRLLRFVFLCSMTALILVFHGLAFSQTGLDFIIRYDADQDGRVSKMEYDGPDFSVYDINNDGFIVLEEAPYPGSPKKGLSFQEIMPTINGGQIVFIVQYDSNEDGKISEEEFTREHFSIYDRDSSGFIEPEEAPGEATAY